MLCDRTSTPCPKALITMASTEPEKPSALEGSAASASPQVNVPGEARADITREELPTGWKYRRWNFGPIHIPPYASPASQLTLVAFVCFLCPGMFNALQGLGGGGQLIATVSDNSNVALYSTFCVVGFAAGSITNRLGIKLTLSTAGLGYSLYIASYLSYNHNQNAGFVYFAGAVLGVCAGMLWAAQGVIMMSYPPEESKGRYISWFWMIFNLGAVIGSLSVSPSILACPGEVQT